MSAYRCSSQPFCHMHLPYNQSCCRWQEQDSSASPVLALALSRKHPNTASSLRCHDLACFSCKHALHLTSHAIETQGCVYTHTAALLKPLCLGLQEELPSQDKMKIGGHKGFMPYMSVAKGIAASLTGPSETAVRDCCTYSRCLRHVSWSWQFLLCHL